LKVPWDIDPHTKAKHAVYQRYLSKWFPIMINGAYKGDVTYAEGFAGPGAYTDKSPGSPVISLRSLRADDSIRMAAKSVRLLFVDKNPVCIRLLNEQIRNEAAPLAVADLQKYGITVDIAQGGCEPTLVDLLTRHQAWGKPMLVNLDTFGGAVSFDLIQRIAGNKSSEVIVTIQPQYFSRFAAVDDIEHGDRVFGSRDWRAVADQPADRKTRWLLEHYRDTIAAAGFTHVLDFELVDANGAALYLVFGTSHDRGLQKMKEAMWEVDTYAGVGYRDPRDPGQQTLEIEIDPKIAPLQRLVVERLARYPRGQATLLQIRKFAFYETVYKESQIEPAVLGLLAAGRVTRESGKSGHLGDWTETISLPHDAAGVGAGTPS